MKDENRVAWVEGMFLRVQHFQQSDRWTERLVRASTRELRPHAWGISEVVIDREALAIGRFALSSARGTMADGTPFEAPNDADLPTPIELSESHMGATIFVALPMRQAGRAELASRGLNGRGSHGVRFVAAPYEAPDANIESDFMAPIEVGRLRLQLLATGDELSGFERIGVARIADVGTDRKVTLDEDFIAPSTNVAASQRLTGLLTEVLGIVRHRAEAVAARIGDPTIRGTAEVGDFLLLQTLNRAEPVLDHLRHNAGLTHPEDAYRNFLSLAGELATFTTETKRAGTFPAYRHDDLEATFRAVVDDLRASLSAVLDQAAVSIALQERRHGVRVGIIEDRKLLEDAGFVIAARAQLPQETLRRTLPNQIKVGPVERIAELVNVALPGIGVRPLPVLPRQLPYRAGTVYFELDTSSPLWTDLGTSGAVAIHLAGEFPGIEMELWAIRE
ncbi:MAG: type VI secretion system baseplate subunit TssK [Pseudomonadota bacterium]